MQLLVGNPTAQSGKNAARIELARRLLDKVGVEHDFLATRSEGRTVGDVAKALSGGAYTGVIAMGGDGTFAEVAKGLLQSRSGVPLGLLPTGTANDQGKSFGLSSDPAQLERNVGVVAAGHVVPLDAAELHSFDELDQACAHDWFFDSAGWGISAKILRMRNEDRRLVGGIPIVRELYRDQLVYAGAIVRAFLASYIEDYKFEAEITVGDQVIYWEGLTDLILKNTRIYAGSWVLDETSSPEDGLVEVVPFRGRDEWIARSIVHLEAVPVYDDTIRPLGVDLLKPPKVSRASLRIHERPLTPAVESQLDGEEWKWAHRHEVQVHRHALRVVVPAPDTP